MFVCSIDFWFSLEFVWCFETESGYVLLSSHLRSWRAGTTCVHQQKIKHTVLIEKKRIHSIIQKKVIFLKSNVNMYVKLEDLCPDLKFFLLIFLVQSTQMPVSGSRGRSLLYHTRAPHICSHYFSPCSDWIPNEQKLKEEVMLTHHLKWHCLYRQGLQLSLTTVQHSSTGSGANTCPSYLSIVVQRHHEQGNFK